jgi:endonuclease YncB( thermonuclease family)
VRRTKKKIPSKKKPNPVKVISTLASFIKKPSLIGFLLIILFIGQYYNDNNNIAPVPAVKEFSSSEIRVIDGDSITLGKLRIRLQGIDAPELKQECLDNKSNQLYKCGEVAKSYLIKLIDKQVVACTNEGLDRYKRQLAYCYVGKLNLNSEMVRTGNALAYSKYDKTFIKEEMEAKANKIGIWASKFENPEQYRKAKFNANKG